jgi:orotate phosphoribosyltransferase
LPKEKKREVMKAELCRILHKIGAIRFGAFKLTTGKISPYYIDLRIVPSFPDAFQKVCEFYLNIINKDVGNQNFDRIAGIPTAGIAFASLIANHFKKPFLYVRKRERLHGRRRRIEGILMPGERVLLVDDLVTTGSSLKKAVAAIRAEGGVINNAVLLLDREEGGKEKLAKNQVTLNCLLRISEAARKLYQIEAISKEQLKTVLNQVKKQTSNG